MNPFYGSSILNSYLSLLGKSFHEIPIGSRLSLEETAQTPHALHIPDATYIITLDVDTLLLPGYALRLVSFLEQADHERIAVAQTLYNAIPNAPGLLERIAGATANLAYLSQQGCASYGVTFWVGACAVLRKAALQTIRHTTQERDFEVTRYIKDRTATEDTESTFDLLEQGWSIYNYPERLAYSATPADFGALLIQRRRWASGGLLLLPKLMHLFWGQPFRLRTLAQTSIRLNYLITTCVGSVSQLLLLLIPFADRSVENVWFLFIAVLCAFLYTRDLVQMGYRTHDAFHLYALHLMLIPIHLGGISMSLYQAATDTKIPFHRTPKVQARTSAPSHYILCEGALLIYCLVVCLLDLSSTRFVHALYTGAHALIFLGIFTWFIGWKASVEDVFRRKEGKSPRPGNHSCENEKPA